MDAEHWQKVQDLFEAAVDLEPVAREEFLKAKCSGNADLLREVRSLIGADNQEHALLDHQAFDLFDSKASEITAGQIIGPYRIIEQIAAGGMGAVFRAEQADGEFSRQVALKLIKRDMVSNEMRRRFKSERQILANLDHPNIARLIDGGVTEDGIPWFSMEFVDGEPIDTYCDSHRLTIRERLELFLEVCRAVQYAQQNLVIHRDLKPSNISITAEGRVKLLDFGIAKLLESETSDPAMVDLTRTGLRVMTPGYASPEQVNGENVTTSSDVYSLGIVLYRLLTGSPPYYLSSNTPQELQRVICQTDPRKPSAAITGGSRDSNSESDDEAPDISSARQTPLARLHRQLVGDLDNICLMALRKEPERRYQAAGLLADDLERYLNGHPVRARKDSLGYRAGKFLGRHRLGVVVGAVALVIVSSLVAFYTVRLAKERDRAQMEATKAAEVSDFLISMFELADPAEAKGEQFTARDMLDQGALRIESELADQPETQAAMFAAVGKVYNQLGLLDKADTLLSQALELRIEHLGLENAETSISLHDLAVLAYDRGEYDRAEDLYRQAWEINRKLYGEANRWVASDMNDLAAVLKLKGDLDGAIELFEKALALRLELSDELDPDVAHSMNHLGGLLHEQGKDERAEELLRRGLAIREQLYNSDHFEVVASLGKLAHFLSDREDYDEAMDMYRRAIAILNKLVGEEHHYVGGLTNSLGNVYFLKGEYDTAEKLHRKSLRILREQLPAGHVNLGYPLVQLGYDLIRMKRPAEAESYLREAVEVRASALSPGHWQNEQAEAVLGICLTDLSRFDEAYPLLEPNLQSQVEKKGYGHWFTIDIAQTLARLYEFTDRPEIADSLRVLIADSN